MAYKDPEKLVKWLESNREDQNAKKRSYYAAHKVQWREQQLKRDFGISLSQWEEMFVGQNGLCAICGDWLKFDGSTQVDHDHRDGKIRALLCGRCNRALSNLRDSSFIAEQAAKYLEVHNGVR